MGVLHDIHCTRCSWERDGVVVDPDAFPPCGKCGGPTTWTPRGFATDVHEPEFNHATGEMHSRHRDVEMHVALQCREYKEKTGIELEITPAGDKVGGARSELKINGSGFSYSGQGSRQSSGERRAAAKKRPKQKRAAAAKPDRHGMVPQRMTADSVRERRTSKVWK